MMLSTRIFKKFFKMVYGEQLALAAISVKGLGL